MKTCVSQVSDADGKRIATDGRPAAYLTIMGVIVKSGVWRFDSSGDLLDICHLDSIFKTAVITALHTRLQIITRNYIRLSGGLPAAASLRLKLMRIRKGSVLWEKV